MSLPPCLLHGWAEEDGEDDEEDTREEVDEQNTEPVENPGIYKVEGGTMVMLTRRQDA